MSIINALVIKDSKISFHRAHYNKIIKLLENPNPKKFLDAGYIIVDFDAKAVFNRQNAFSIKDISSKQIKKMMLFTL